MIIQSLELAEVDVEEAIVRENRSIRTTGQIRMSGWIAAIHLISISSNVG